MAQRGPGPGVGLPERVLLRLARISSGMFPRILAVDPGSDALFPTGSITAYGGATAPSGYLLCNGAAVSRTTYDALFDIIGTAYGVGDGSTTFNLPDMRAAVPAGYKAADANFGTLGATVGAATHAVSSSEMPSHTHTGPAHVHTGPSHTHTGPSHVHSGPAHSHGILLDQDEGGNSRPQSANGTSAAPTGGTESGGTGDTGSGGTGATGSGGTGDTGSAGTGATGGTGSGTAMSLVQVSATVNFIIKT